MYEPHSQTQEDSALAYAPFILDPALHDDSPQGLEIKYMDMLQQSDSLEMMLQSQSTSNDFTYYENIPYGDESFNQQQHHDTSSSSSLDPLYQEQYPAPQFPSTGHPPPPPPSTVHHHHHHPSMSEQHMYPFGNSSMDTVHQTSSHPPPPYSFAAAAVAADPTGMMIPPAPMPQPNIVAPSPLVSSSSSSSLSSSTSYPNPAEPRQQIYVRKACVSCKQSHVACDVQRPCARCVRLNKADTCVDAERKKRGRPCGSGKKKRQQAQAQAAAAAAAAAAASRYPRI